MPVLLLVLPSAAPAAGVAVTACGEEITGPAELVADLDCSDFAGPALRVFGGTLALGGHMVRAAPGETAIECARGPSCAIRGPGLIEGGARGVLAYAKSLRLTDLEITGATGPAVFHVPFGAVTATRVTAMGNGSGLSGNGSVRVAESTIVGNEGTGVGARLVRAWSSTVQGNGSDPATCTSSPDLCADIVSAEAPDLRDTSCGVSSRRPGPFTTWGVCEND